MRRLLAAIAATATLLTVALVGPAHAATGPLTNRLSQTFTSGGLTSTYHIFAAGLDWSKPVGLLMYTDGSGAYGLDNPNSTYLLDADGSAGLVAVAKKHNLLLVTPIAPPPSDADGDNCWYNMKTSPNGVAKAAWASALMTKVKADYPIAANRVAIGGYSSGAQWTTEFFLPAHGEAQSVDLAVPISYGGAPVATPQFSAAYKASTVVSWDVGTADTYGYSTAAYGARGGYSWYRNNGFAKAEANWVQGEDHSRDGRFDTIMDRELTQHLPAATATPAPTPTTAPTPTAAPAGTSLQAYVTGYSYYDNTPPGSAAISHPVLHPRAGGVGTYADPITVAVGHSLATGSDVLDWPKGTRFYIPAYHRYFIVEDTCGDGPTPQNGPCHTGYAQQAAGTSTWLDVWVGGQAAGQAASDACMSKITNRHTVIKDPPANYVVTAGEVASGPGGCAALYGEAPVTA